MRDNWEKGGSFEIKPEMRNSGNILKPNQQMESQLECGWWKRSKQAGTAAKVKWNGRTRAAKPADERQASPLQGEKCFDVTAFLLPRVVAAGGWGGGASEQGVSAEGGCEVGVCCTHAHLKESLCVPKQTQGAAPRFPDCFHFKASCHWRHSCVASHYRLFVLLIAGTGQWRTLKFGSGAQGLEILNIVKQSPLEDKDIFSFLHKTVFYFYPSFWSTLWFKLSGISFQLILQLIISL